MILSFSLRETVDRTCLENFVDPVLISSSDGTMDVAKLISSSTFSVWVLLAVAPLNSSALIASATASSSTFTSALDIVLLTLDSHDLYLTTALFYTTKTFGLITSEIGTK